MRRGRPGLQVTPADILVVWAGAWGRRAWRGRVCHVPACRVPARCFAGRLLGLCGGRGAQVVGRHFDAEGGGAGRGDSGGMRSGVEGGGHDMDAGHAPGARLK